MRRSPGSPASGSSRLLAVESSCRSLQCTVHGVADDDILLPLRLAETRHRGLACDAPERHRRAGPELGVLTASEKPLPIEDVVEEGDAAVAAERAVGLEKGHLLGEVGVPDRLSGD